MLSQVYARYVRRQLQLFSAINYVSADKYRINSDCIKNRIRRGKFSLRKDWS